MAMHDGKVLLPGGALAEQIRGSRGASGDGNNDSVDIQPFTFIEVNEHTKVMTSLQRLPQTRCDKHCQAGTMPRTHRLVSPMHSSPDVA